MRGLKLRPQNPASVCPIFSTQQAETEKNIREEVQPEKFHLLVFSKEKIQVNC